MADQRKRLSELPSSTNTDGLYTLGVNAQNEGVKIPFGDIIDSVKKMSEGAQTASSQTISRVLDLEGRLAETDEKVSGVSATQTALALDVSAMQTTLDQVKEVTDSKGADCGITPLDDQGLVPEEYIDGRFDNAKYFSGILRTLDDDPEAVRSTERTAHSSTDEGCGVFFVEDDGVFVLLVEEDGTRTYYPWWADARFFGNFGSGGGLRCVAVPGKLYVNKHLKRVYYRADDGSLTPVGSTLGTTAGTAFAGDKGADLTDRVDALEPIVKAHATVNANALMGTTRAMELGEFLDWVDNNIPGVSKLLPAGTCVSYLSAEGWKESRFTGTDADSQLHDTSCWKEVAATGGSGTINVTAEFPKEDEDNPYYDLSSAVRRIADAKRMALGLQITFAATAVAWKQYQYTGASVDTDVFCNPANWLDMAAASAGQEAVININSLCGEPQGEDFYTFETATAALTRLEDNTKVTYRKAGMVITYRTASAEWETLQLTRPVSDFGNRAAWADFGGGGSKVETKDEPAAGGTDAFSTGGAYNMLPTQNEVTQEDGTVSIRFMNAAGNDVMEPVTFVASGGGGGEMSGTVVSVKFEKSPLFGALGSTISTRAAIRSVTMAGSEEVDNAIARLELIDRDSNVTVWSEDVNRASSADMSDFCFTIDFTSIMTQAGQRRFSLRVTDEAGYTTTKFLTVTAEDITVSVRDVQVLNVRKDAMITPTMDRVSVDLFKFANNQSDKGIDALVEILIDGEWRELHRSTVTDTFTRTVTFSPLQLGLRHGSYPLRICGTSLNSGVRGNTVYTAIMVVDPEETRVPIVAIRYDDTVGGTVRLLDTISFDVAVYNPAADQTITNTRAGATFISQLLCDNYTTYNVSKQIQGFADGAEFELYAKVVKSGEGAPDYRSYGVPLRVSGSVIDAALKEGAIYNFDFSSRTNDEADHSIVDGEYEVKLTGSNYRTNGFTSYLGENCLCIAENVTASLNHAPFAAASLESAGMAWQCRFATNHIKDPDAMLLECYDPTSGAGFYIRGNKVGIYCRTGAQSLEERSFRCGEKITFGVVVEPSSTYVERSGVKYCHLRMYLNGELVGHIGYTPGQGNLFNSRNITMDGTNGNLYLYYMLAYQSHYEWAQAFKNHLVKQTDVGAMIEEFNAENVLVSQTAEGSTAMRPSAAALWARGIPYCVLVASDDKFNEFDNGTSTSDNFEMDVYYYDPIRPWRSFKATKCRTRRQGTTSAKRAKKNDRIYLSKATEIMPLFPDYTNADAIITYALFKLKKIRVGENTMAIDLTTVKIDYSDAGGANDCGVCDMMNATYRALGVDYMTPAQRFFDGTQDIGDVHLTGLELNHSTANHPIAVFRSTSDTLQNVYFEAKGNWKEDKGEQTALGFMNTPGYTMGCLNYQDGSFVEYYGLKGETLDQTEARFRADQTVSTDQLYLLTQYCGNRYRFLRYEDGAWVVKTGSMKQVNGKGSEWKVEGYVLNPVGGFELLNYQGFCWFRGVDSVDEMMRTGTGLISSWVQKLISAGKMTENQAPQWTYYFECMVDSDDLALAYATGRKVPYELYRLLRFCDGCDPDKHPGTYEADWSARAYKYMNVRSYMVYYAATDYNSLYDQQAKNMQPMHFLEDGCYVENGVYYNSYDEEDSSDVERETEYQMPVRFYFNKVYDADGANGKDNDGGCTGDPECDPGKPTDEATGYSNPYAGWNSILWVNLRQMDKMAVDDAGTETDLRTVVAAMRSVDAVVDGVTMKPFSPEGAMYFFMDKRLRIWPKVVSSYDGIRKYVQYTATSDAIYFYALQGLGLTSLPDFIDRRWRIRDGYYQTGAFFSGYISFRIACREDARIRIRAAKTGYFGLGNDSTMTTSDTVYLEAGQSFEFTKFSHQTGALLYIYQADRMSEIDLSEVSIGTSDGKVDLSVMTLVESLRLGSDTYATLPTGYTGMSGVTLGSLPFLEEIDIRRTGIKNLDCSGCPRLRRIDARDSALESFAVAETSPINDIAVPGAVTDLILVGLPELTYSGLGASTGLQIPSLRNVQKLRMESSPKLNGLRLLSDVLDGQTEAPALSQLRMADMTLKGDASELAEVVARRVAGMDSSGGYSAKPVVNAVYQLATILEQAEINRLENAIDGLELFTIIDAFIEFIDALNREYYGGASEVETVTLDNVGEHLAYYNGETYQEYEERIAQDNRSIHDIINE